MSRQSSVVVGQGALNGNESGINSNCCRKHYDASSFVRYDSGRKETRLAGGDVGEPQEGG